MPYQDLSRLGYTPEGAGAGSFLETVISGVEASGKFVDSYLAGQEKQQKKQKDKIDAYVTLRKAGYPEKASYEAVNSWDFSKLQGVNGAGDLETEKTKKEIEKIEAETEYSKAKKKALEGKDTEAKLFDDPNDILEEAGGLPLKSIKQDKKTGLWYGEYGKGSADEEIVIPDVDTTTSGAPEKKEWTAPTWLSNIIGKFEKKSNAPAKNAPAAETKVVQGVTYKRGFDGKWHKQK